MLTATQISAQPGQNLTPAAGATLTLEPSVKSSVDLTKNVEWYQPVIKSMPQSTIEFFEKYVNIKGEQAIKKHIYHVRDKAWKV